MTRSISEILSSLTDDTVKPVFAVDLMFDSTTTTFAGEEVTSSPLYLHTGLGDLTIGSVTYVGTGSLMQISDVSEGSDISARGINVQLSGIPTDILALALSLSYRGRVFLLKMGMLDANDTTSSLSTIFVGYMDCMDIAEGPETSVMTLAAESKLINLERPRIRRYTSENQKALHSGDLAFDFINDLIDKPSAWGREA